MNLKPIFFFLSIVGLVSGFQIGLGLDWFGLDWIGLDWILEKFEKVKKKKK